MERRGHDTKWFSPSESSFMINYRVDNMDELLASAKEERRRDRRGAGIGRERKICLDHGSRRQQGRTVGANDLGRKEQECLRWRRDSQEAVYEMQLGNENVKSRLFLFPAAVQRDLDVERWFEQAPGELVAAAKSWFDVMLLGAATTFGSCCTTGIQRRA